MLPFGMIRAAPGLSLRIRHQGIAIATLQASILCNSVAANLPQDEGLLLVTFVYVDEICPSFYIAKRLVVNRASPWHLALLFIYTLEIHMYNTTNRIRAAASYAQISWSSRGLKHRTAREVGSCKHVSLARTESAVANISVHLLSKA